MVPSDNQPHADLFRISPRWRDPLWRPGLECALPPLPGGDGDDDGAAAGLLTRFRRLSWARLVGHPALTANDQFVDDSKSSSGHSGRSAAAVNGRYCQRAGWSFRLFHYVCVPSSEDVSLLFCSSFSALYFIDELLITYSVFYDLDRHQLSEYIWHTNLLLLRVVTTLRVVV